MSKDRVASSGMWFGELFQIGVYKRSQGRVTRQATFAALAVIVALGAWSFYAHFGPSLQGRIELLVAGGILLIGLWLATESSTYLASRIS
jgi:preprotein translocase subunit SecE